MTEAVRHLIGYEPDTGKPVFDMTLDPALLPRVQTVVRPYEDDPAFVETYELDLAQANELATMMGVAAPARLAFYIQSFKPQADEKRAVA